MNDSTRFSRIGYPGLAVCLVLLLLLPSQLQMLGGNWIRQYDGALFRGLFTLVLLAALVPIAGRRRALVTGGLLALPVLTSHWLFGEEAMFYRALFSLVFVAYIGICLLRALLRARGANVETICCAISFYLLAGIGWAFLYTSLEFLHPGSFKNLASDQGAYYTLGELLYFSFVTMTTVGFGDINPATPAVRSWAYLQAVFGQLYIAVVVARLVAMQLVECGNGGHSGR